MKQIFSLFILLTMSIVTFSQENRVPSKGLALYAKDGDFQPYEFSRHAVGDNDILIDIMYSGICHSDIHMGKSEWGNISYPFVGGHEIAGRVARVGKMLPSLRSEIMLV